MIVQYGKHNIYLKVYLNVWESIIYKTMTNNQTNHFLVDSNGNFLFSSDEFGDKWLIPIEESKLIIPYNIDKMVKVYWMNALSKYNEGKTFCHYKKGTPQYAEVKKIFDRMKKGKPTLEKKESSIYRAGVSKEAERKGDMSEKLPKPKKKKVEPEVEPPTGRIVKKGDTYKVVDYPPYAKEVVRTLNHQFTLPITQANAWLHKNHKHNMEEIFSDDISEGLIRTRQEGLKLPTGLFKYYHDMFLNFRHPKSISKTKEREAIDRVNKMSDLDGYIYLLGVIKSGKFKLDEDISEAYIDGIANIDPNKLSKKEQVKYYTAVKKYGISIPWEYKKENLGKEF
jgi:hypothetical protein